jgi:hypothetical protein
MPPQISRLIAIFSVLILAFVTVRWVLKPESFYQYGHYRGRALTEALVRTPAYQPRAACAECHDEQAAQNAAGPHSKISCQTCHGPGREHLDDPSTKNIQKPPVRETCLRCHEQRAARPHWHVQINEQEHADGAACGDCHSIHNPSEVK